MRRLALVPMLLLGLALVPACSGDDDGAEPATTTSAAAPATTAPDPEEGLDLTALLVEAGELPTEFGGSSSADDTITAFCAGEDAAAGLSASGRAVRGFTRDGGGASVIQLVFRFRDGGAATFVEQAAAILDRCSGVPDLTGLAFDYEPLAPSVEAPVAAVADAHVGRHGVNVGSGSLSIDVVVFHRGDVGQLAAVLAVDTPRAELDELAAATFTAIAARARGA